MLALAAIRVVSGAWATWKASSLTSSSRRSSGTTRLMRPISFASWAVSSWPVYMYSEARFQFMNSHGSMPVSIVGIAIPWRTGNWK